MVFAVFSKIFQGNSESASSVIPPASNPDAGRTQEAAQPIFQNSPPEASLANRVVARVMGYDEKAAKDFDKAISQISALKKPAANPADRTENKATAAVVPSAAQTPPVSSPVVVPAIYIEDDVAPAAPAPAVPSIKESQPPVIGSSRAAVAAQGQTVKAQFPTPSLLSRAISLIQGQGSNLIDGVIDAFRKRKELIGKAIRELQNQHKEYKLPQIHALYEQEILSSPPVREQAEKMYQIYTQMMERVKSLKDEKDVNSQAFVQAARRVLLEKLSSPGEREEFETTLLIVKAQHYFATYGPANPGSTCLENFLDHFEEDVQQALKERVGSNLVHVAALKERIENEFLKAVAIVPGALESVVMYRHALPGEAGQEALIEQRKKVIQRLRNMMKKSPKSEREQSERLKCLDSLPAEERKAYLAAVGVRDSKTELGQKLQRFGS